ncbi:MAG: hypothetical protein ABGX16_14510 [Pirellulales bacterium]
MTAHIKCHASKLLILATTFVTAAHLQAEANKRVLTMDDYARWQSVTSTKLSHDGNWVTYDYRKPEAEEDAADERNLQIKHLASDRIYQIPFAISPAFSDDSR